MALADEWTTLLAALRTNAPKTAMSIRPPAPAGVVDRALAAMGVQQVSTLREFYSLHDGEGEGLSVGDAPGSIFPAQELFSIEEVASERAMMIAVWERLTAANPGRFPGGYKAIAQADPVAGGRTGGFIPQYIPISGSDGYYYFCDTRPGKYHGCIRAFDRDDSDEDGAQWPSIEAMIADVRASIMQQKTFDGWGASTDTGAVFWTPLHAAPAADPKSMAPRPIEVPFAEPVVSDAADAPIVDRDLIARSVLEQAAADHPGRSVTGGYPILQHVPCLPGFVAGCAVFVDGRPTSYIAVVAGEDHFLCVRVPDHGLRLVYRPRTP